MYAWEEPEPKRLRIEETGYSGYEEVFTDPYAECADLIDLPSFYAHHGCMSNRSFLIALLISVAKFCDDDPNACSDACQFFRGPNAIQLDLDNHSGAKTTGEMLVEHEHDAVMRFAKLAESFPQEIAWCYEFMQVIWPDLSDDGDLREYLDQNPTLEYFRIAQKIRDDHGIFSLDTCQRFFNSFSDISEMEEDLARGDTVNFLHHCYELNGTLEVYGMYKFMNTFAQLRSFHRAIYPIAARHRYSGQCDVAIGYRFDELAEELKSSSEIPKPTWSELKFFLSKPNVGSQELLGMVCHVTIPKERLDEAMRCVLRYLRRCLVHMAEQNVTSSDETHSREGFVEDLETASRVLRMLLDKGATMDYREPHEFLQREQSTLGLLIELWYLNTDFPLMDFQKYICCPLRIGESGVGFKRFNSAKLSCLAARKVGPLRNYSLNSARLSCLAARKVGPLRNYSLESEDLRSRIRMHQDLRLQLGSEGLRFAIDSRRLFPNPPCEISFTDDPD